MYNGVTAGDVTTGNVMIETSYGDVTLVSCDWKCLIGRPRVRNLFNQTMENSITLLPLKCVGFKMVNPNGNINIINVKW